ncbi:MAG: helix-turn-helix domain-containing protein, partial [bacterium]|nr:helix-turn-helix domain-containing protein [bacterium]
KGEFAKLPPDVYVRGMLAKYAKAIDADAEELWQKFQEESLRKNNSSVFKTAKRSGLLDRLPKNRFINISTFVLTPKLATLFFVGLILFSAGIYFVYQLKYLVGPPVLIVSEPARDIVTNQKNIKLSGRVEVGAILTINGRPAGLEDNGSFSQDLEVQPGINIIEFLAKNHLGKTALIRRTIIFEDKPADSPPTTNISATSTY